MGWNSTILVLNDALHEIKKDKEFGFKISEAINELSLYPSCVGQISVSSGGFCRAAIVIETHHAEGNRLLAVGGDQAIDLGILFPHGEETYDIRILKALADKLGYYVCRKRKVNQ